MPDNRKTILITGCSSGIGYTVAHGLAKNGWRVFATCRNAVDCERLKAEGLESFPLDYDDPQSIISAVAETLSLTGGTMDAVFNNGAYGTPGLLEDLPRDALRANFETNFFGQHELTRLLIPAMRAQGRGRILMNSSVLGFIGLTWRGADNATKFAVEGWADTLRLEMAGTGIHVVLIEPGPITSNIRQNSVPHFEKWIDHAASARASDYQSRLIPRIYNEGVATNSFELPAGAVIKPVLQALTHPNPRARYRITVPTKALAIVKRLVSTRMLDRLLRRV